MAFLEVSGNIIIRDLLLKSLLVRTAAAGFALLMPRWFPNFSNRLMQSAAARRIFLFGSSRQMFIEVSRILIDLGLIAGLSKVCKVSPAVVSLAHLVAFNDTCGQFFLPQGFKLRRILFRCFIRNDDGMKIFSMTGSDIRAIALFQSVRITSHCIMCTLVKKFYRASPYRLRTLALASVIDFSLLYASFVISYKAISWMPFQFRATPARCCALLYTFFCGTFFIQNVVVDTFNRFFYVRLVEPLQGFVPPTYPEYLLSSFHEFLPLDAAILNYFQRLTRYYGTSPTLHNGIRFQCIKYYWRIRYYKHLVETGALQQSISDFEVDGKGETFGAGEQGPSSACMRCKKPFAVGDPCWRLLCGHSVCRPCALQRQTFDWCAVCQQPLAATTPAREGELMKAVNERFATFLVPMWERQNPLPMELCWAEWVEAATFLHEHGYISRYEANFIPGQSTPCVLQGISEWLIDSVAYFLDLCPLNSGFLLKIREI